VWNFSRLASAEKMDAAPARDSLWEAKFLRLTLVSHFSAKTHFGVSLYLHGSLWRLTLPISLSKDRYSPPLNMPVILTAEEILCIGLSYKGFTVDRQRVRRQQNIDRFVSFYGSKPEVCAQIWEDLQGTNIPDARIHMRVADDIKPFLMTLHFFKSYHYSSDLAGAFKCSERTVNTKIWFFAARIQALKGDKVRKQWCHSQLNPVVTHICPICCHTDGRSFGQKLGQLAAPT
jgi:hypothetical protein